MPKPWTQDQVDDAVSKVLEPEIVEHTASAVLTLTDFGKIHVADHTINAIVLTVPKGTNDMKGKPISLYKWGAADVSFKFNASDTIMDSAAGASLQNTVAAQAKIAKTSVVYIGVNRWMVDSDIGSWTTV